MGDFIQLGVTPTVVGKSADGFGEFVTVEKLEQLEKERVRKQLENVRPELLANGVKIVQQKLEADAAFEQLKRDLHLAVGNDGVNTAVGMMTAEAREKAKVAKPVAKK